MKVATHADIVSVIGNGYSEFVIDSWLELDSQMFLGSDRKPFGLIGTKMDEENDILYIASTAINPDIVFNYEMLKHILTLNREHDISVITDMPEYRDRIKKALAPHGFLFTIEEDIMFSSRNATIPKTTQKET